MKVKVSVLRAIFDFLSCKVHVPAALVLSHMLKIEMHTHAYPQPLGVASQWRSRYLFSPPRLTQILT
ncbi:hypothetical protein DFH06DRAFT_1317153 [Mycena polygramma]|nr:hypothetical protein DFH06DRAFT_1317153 [Mycena polygramma]